MVKRKGICLVIAFVLLCGCQKKEDVVISIQNPVDGPNGMTAEIIVKNDSNKAKWVSTIPLNVACGNNKSIAEMIDYKVNENIPGKTIRKYSIKLDDVDCGSKIIKLYDTCPDDCKRGCSFDEEKEEYLCN